MSTDVAPYNVSRAGRGSAASDGLPLPDTPRQGAREGALAPALSRLDVAWRAFRQGTGERGLAWRGPLANAGAMGRTWMRWGDSVWTEITERAQKAQRRRVAVAFVGRGAPKMLPLDKGDELYVDASTGALAQGATNPEALAAYLKKGVGVWSLRGLHAKVCLFDRTAVIGSANASAHSQSSLEAVCVTTEPEVVAEARAFLDGLAGRADDLIEVDDTFVRAARLKYRDARPSPMQVGHRLLPDVGGFPLVVAGTQWGEFSNAAEQTVTRRWRTVQRATGPKARFGIGMIELTREDRDAYGEGQVLLQVYTGEDGTDWVWPPATVVAVSDVGDRRQGQVVFLREDRTLDPKPYEEFRQTVGGFGVSSPTSDRAIQSAHRRAAALGLWELSET